MMKRNKMFSQRADNRKIVVEHDGDQFEDEPLSSLRSSKFYRPSSIGNTERTFRNNNYMVPDENDKLPK